MILLVGNREVLRRRFNVNWIGADFSVDLGESSNYWCETHQRESNPMVPEEWQSFPG